MVVYWRLQWTELVDGMGESKRMFDGETYWEMARWKTEKQMGLQH